MQAVVTFNFAFEFSVEIRREVVLRFYDPQRVATRKYIQFFIVSREKCKIVRFLFCLKRLLQKMDICGKNALGIQMKGVSFSSLENFNGVQN